MLNKIVFSITLSSILLLVYMPEKYFCVLILYPTTLPNSLINSSSFLVAFVRFSMCSIMSSAKNDSFASCFFFSSLNSFYFFFFSDCHGYNFQNNIE